MSPDPHAVRHDDEIAEIENRRGTRTLFLALGGFFGLLLLVIVVYGAKERARLRAEEARPRTAELELGRHLGTVSNTAVFSDGQRLSYVEGVGEAPLDNASFVRPVEYDQAGTPVEVPATVTHWSMQQRDSLPYVVEPVMNPLTGVTLSDYQSLDLASLDASDFGTGGPGDWQPLEREETEVSVTGRVERTAEGVSLTAGDSRVRIQGIEGLSGLDSLEMAWATANGTELSAFGRIGNTPRGGDPLFVLIISAVDPPHSAEPEAEAPADTAAPAAP
jgi:hypothetical protein